MIRFKEGVKWQGVSPEIVLAILAAGGVIAGATTDGICWVTSIRDGKHKAGSRHYIGEAFDARSKNIMASILKGTVLQELKKLLPDYFVDLEYPGEENEHFHIQRNEGFL
jgi:hypothetical protein